MGSDSILSVGGHFKASHPGSNQKPPPSGTGYDSDSRVARKPARGIGSDGELCIGRGSARMGHHTSPSRLLTWVRPSTLPRLREGLNGAPPNGWRK